MRLFDLCLQRFTNTEQDQIPARVIRVILREYEHLFRSLFFVFLQQILNLSAVFLPHMVIVRSDKALPFASAAVVKHGDNRNIIVNCCIDTRDRLLRLISPDDNAVHRGLYRHLHELMRIVFHGETAPEALHINAPFLTLRLRAGIDGIPESAVLTSGDHRIMLVIGCDLLDLFACATIDQVTVKQQPERCQNEYCHKQINSCFPFTHKIPFIKISPINQNTPVETTGVF